MRLAFERIGTGPPLVLLHGIGHRRQAWHPVVDQLAEQREVILVDLPGHGESDPLSAEGRPIPDVLGEAIRTFLAEQQLERPHLAGNSLGGRIALEAGAAGDARSVTALSPAGFWGSDLGFVYTRQVFAAVSGLSRTLEPQARRLVNTRAGRWLAYGWIHSHPTRVDPDRALADFRAFRAAQPALRSIMTAATPFGGWPVGDVPVTIAWATRDLVLPLYQARRARALLPCAEHVLLRGCGHVPMNDDPALVAEVLLRGSA